MVRTLRVLAFGTAVLLAAVASAAPGERLLVLHLDFNTVQLTREAVLENLRVAADAGYNAVLWEVENKIRWTTCPDCVHPEAFSKEEFREILSEARKLGLKPIPLLQTFGHAEYVLMKAHPEWKENASDPACYCVSKPEVRDFLRRMVDEYLEVFGPVEDFHLGGDEAAAFCTCPVCSKRGRMDLYAEHLNAVSEALRTKGIRPGVWCDMILSEMDPAETAKIPRDYTVWHWDYEYDGKTAPTETTWSGKSELLQKLGFDVIFCPSSASYTDGPFLPRYGRHADNIAASAALAREKGMRGLCVTSWSIRESTKCLQRPLWQFAARRYLNPADDPAADFAAAFAPAFGSVRAETLRDLSNWNDLVCPFDGRDWLLHYKPAVPAPAGSYAKIIETRRAKDPSYLEKARTYAERRLKAVENALKDVKQAKSGTETPALVTGARLTRAFLGEVLAALDGRSAGSVPEKATAAFYGVEQAPASAANSAAIVWSVLKGRQSGPKAAREDFECLFGIRYKPEAEALIVSNESFRTMIPTCRPNLVKKDDGTVTFDLAGMTNNAAEIARAGAFVIEFQSRPGHNWGLFYDGVFDHDQTEYAAWKDAHPEFRRFSMYEMAHDASLRWLEIGRAEKERNDGAIPLSDATLEKFKAAQLPASREDYVAQVLKPHFDRVCEFCFDDKPMMSVGEGHSCIQHLLGYWGVGGVGIETTRDRVYWQTQVMFCRGAARQFDIPWHWYVASYAALKNDEGRKVSTALKAEEMKFQHHKHGPNFGTSLSAMKRVTYLTWLAGAASYQREGVWATHFKTQCTPPEVSPEGRMFDAFRRFTRAHERGVPQQPIAILTPAARGYSRRMGQAFGLYEYTHADKMLDAVMSTVLELGRNDSKSDRDACVERTQANSRYGDLFDVLVPDFEDQTAFARTIGGYRAAILCGDYGRNPAMERILTDYVRQGGTLVLNVRQLGGFFDGAFAGDGEAVAPSFTEKCVGRGRVIVCSLPWMCPWKDGEEAGVTDGVPRALTGEYPEVAWILGRLLREFAPVTVDGFVQWGVNRTADGFLVYLMNNSGVVRKYGVPEEIAPGGTAVTVNLSKVGSLSVRELLTGETIAIDGNTAALTVPYGDVRILEVKCHNRKEHAK